MGGVFTDLFLAVALISHHIPKNWIVAVKEHPGQYLEYGSYNYIGRHKDYYRPYAGLSNVRFVSNELPHYELVDRSQCVASVNGTVGWQSLVRGKPVMVFGESWYRSAPGAYSVHDKTSCQKAVARIIKNPHLKETQLLQWLTAFLKLCSNEFYLTKEDAAEWEQPFESQKTIRELCRYIKKHI